MRGSRIGADYTLCERIGRGGMGTVWSAEQRSTGRRVAIKLLDAGVSDGPRAARFSREAAALGRLNHPHIVTVLSAGETEDGDRYLAMELVDGRTLRAILRESGPLAPERVARLSVQLTEALAYAHGREVVHRDVKPSNVMIVSVMGREHVKVLDFGLAKLLDGGGDDPTGSGRVLGSAPYMAPEQWSEEPNIDGRADLYSLGCLTYQLLTGRLPFEAASMVGFMKAHMAGAPADAVTLRPELAAHPRLLRVVRHCMARDRTARPATAAALLDALRRLDDAEEAPTTADAHDATASWSSGLGAGWRSREYTTEEPGPAATPVPRRRRRWWWALAASAAIVAALSWAIVAEGPDRLDPFDASAVIAFASAAGPDAVAVEIVPTPTDPAPVAPARADPPTAAPPARDEATSAAAPVAPPAEQPRTITLTSLPLGARVKDGDAVLGATPVAIILGADEARVLTLERRGHRRAVITLRGDAVATGDTTTVTLRPRPPADDASASDPPTPSAAGAVHPTAPPPLDLERLRIR